jgi:predicted ester cyclase
MSVQEDIDRLHQFVTELNQGNMESVRNYMAADFFSYSPKPDEPSAREVFYELLFDLKAAFPDLHVTLQDLHSEGELLKGQMTLNGTKRGPLWGTPASGVPVTWSIPVSFRSINGHYAVNLEEVSLPNLIGTLVELDLVNPPDQMDKPTKYPVVIPEIILKVLFTGQVADKPCSHLDEIKVIEPATRVCEECVAASDVWPALRMCLICGYVGCCDTSKNKHMKQHYEATGHPLFRSIRLDEGWVWCYEDDAFFSKRLLEKYR